MPVNVDVSVQGVREALRDLRRVEPDLYWQCLKEIKDAAGPIVADIDAEFPAEGPTGFRHGGRTGWGAAKPTVTQYGGRRSGRMARAQVWPLLRVKIVDAPRQIFDMAGAAEPGNKLDRGLQKGGYGTASRAVWRVSEQVRREANRQMIEAMRKVTAKANRRLRVIRAGV